MKDKDIEKKLKELESNQKTLDNRITSLQNDRESDIKISNHRIQSLEKQLKEHDKLFIKIKDLIETLSNNSLKINDKIIDKMAGIQTRITKLEQKIKVS